MPHNERANLSVQREELLVNKLVDAADSGHARRVQRLLRGTVINVNRRHSYFGWTALERASEGGYARVVQILLDRGASVVISRDKNRSDAVQFYSCLASPCRHGHIAVVRLLLQHGVDANLTNVDGQTPLAYAIQGGHIDVVQLLLDHGAKFNEQDDFGRTDLYLAIEEGRVEILRLLLQYGAAVHIQDSDGWTPLACASAYGHVAVAQLLLEYGADANGRNLLDHAWTPLFYATNQGHDQVVRLLLQRGSANPNVLDADGRTALHRSAYWGDVEIVQALLDHGADISLLDPDDKTALQLACEQGHLSAIYLLLQKGMGDGSTIRIARSILMRHSSSRIPALKVLTPSLQSLVKK